MDFQEFWRQAIVELRHTQKFKTLSRSCVFDAKASASDKITATPSCSGIDRVISMRRFQRMWDLMKNDDRSERYKSINGRYGFFPSSSYASALIDHIVKDQDME